MVMRVGGLATGMDIEGIVNKLMEAERIPLNKMEQDRTQLEWKRDAFRDVNRSLLELSEMMLDMKLSTTYNSKTVTSSQENAVTATGTTSSSNGTYNIKVDQLATSAMNVGKALDKEFDPNAPLKESDTFKFTTDESEPFKFTTYDKDGGQKEHTFEVKEGDTLNQVLKRITDDDNNVRAFYDSQSQKVVLETTRTGKYNENGPEITFDEENTFFAELGLFSREAQIVDGEEVQVGETGGTNAVFTYNDGLTIETQNNSYELNGIDFQFNSTTVGNATLTVTNDVDASFNSIMKFVDKYNEVIEKLNGSQTEEKFRDFKPLSNEEKKAMSEDEIKKWEEKAMSGILRGESSLSNGMYSMRQSWYSNVETDGAFNSLIQIGITTTSDYMDGGKLKIDEEQLKEVLRDNPGDVQKLFSNVDKEDSRGLINRLEDSLKATMSSIEERAGKSTHTLDNYTLGKRMKELNDRIFNFEARMVKVETRHWNQFTQMEKAIQRMNDQSSQLFSQFG